MGQSTLLENERRHRKHHKIRREIVKMDLQTERFFFHQKPGQQNLTSKGEIGEKLSVNFKVMMNKKEPLV
jgi:hypothetical protein